ncbi:Snf7-domain-containing protein [Phycomyces nitens]|nr:Snf7-domain-containing protein [Phycomyces nitens]
MGSNASKNKITAQDKAILDLKIQRDKLKQYQKKLNVVLEKEVSEARKALGQGNKKKALLALKKKKYQEQLLEKTDQQLMNLEELTNTIEFALVEKQVMEGLKGGNATLKEIHKEMSLEDVEKLMDDTEDAIAYQNELDEMLSGRITAEDEEEILRELEGLRQEELEAALPEVPNHPLPETERTEVSYPEVPTHTPIASSSKSTEKQAMLAI